MKNIIILYSSLLLSAQLSANAAASQTPPDHESPPLYWLADETNPALPAAITTENGTTTYFQYDPVTKQVAAEFTGDGSTICKRRFFTYDNEDRLTSIVVDDVNSPYADELAGLKTRYETTFSYCQEGAAYGLLAEIEENRLSIATGTSYCLNRITNSYDLDGNLQQQEISSGRKNPSGNHPAFSKKSFIGDYLHDKWNNFMHGLFGKDFLQFAGYYQGKTSTGTFHADQEMHDKVRVSLINGILNVSADMETILTKISKTHGDISVHYVFRPTEGWTNDLWNCTFVKFGYISEPARLMAEKWKALIHEMGGTDGGGSIVHYAHSIGATDTYAAKDLLSPAEQRMIHIVTLGSPSLIPNNAGFGSVANYASRRDGVCLFDPVGYHRAFTDSDSNVYFCGSLVGMPEHSVYADTYCQVIEQLGERSSPTTANNC